MNNSKFLYSLKDTATYQILSQDIINNINKYLQQSDNVIKNKNNKITNNILKNNHLQYNKNKNENKFILILNKVSLNNINELLIEFLENINISSIEDYEILQRIFFMKIIKEIDLLEIYYTFILNIFKIIYYKYKFEPLYFIKLIYLKIENDYKNINFTNEYNFLDELNIELYRINCLKVIKFLVNNNFLKNDTIIYINNIIYKQNRYIPDIVHWSKVNIINDIIKNKLKIINCDNMRDKILLESILYNNIDNNTEINIEHIEDEESENKIEILIKNIIEEYLYIQSDEDIVEFLKNDCNNNNDRNLFCYYLLLYYLERNDENILKLLCYLIDTKQILKNNISSGFINLFNKNILKNKVDINKIKRLLVFFKSKNITKDIEYIYKKYNVSYKF
jgi:hypothetical protein